MLLRIASAWLRALSAAMLAVNQSNYSRNPSS